MLNYASELYRAPENAVFAALLTPFHKRIWLSFLIKPTLCCSLCCYVWEIEKTEKRGSIIGWNK